MSFCDEVIILQLKVYDDVLKHFSTYMHLNHIFRKEILHKS